MGLLASALKQILPAGRGGPLVFFPRATEVAGREGVVGERDYARDVRASDNSIVVATINWIARNFPEAPPALWERRPGQTRLRVEEHEMLERLEEPNPVYPGVVLWMATETSWCLDGNAYWLKIRSRAGLAVEYWYAPHWMLEPKGEDRPRSAAEFITHYDYRPSGGVSEKIPPANVVHFRFGVDPDNPRKGRSQLHGLLREVYTDEEAARFSASILRNLGVPGVVVSPDKELRRTLSQAEMDAIKARFMQEFGGDKRGEPIVLNKPTQVTQFGFNPQEMDLSAIRDVAEERVTAALGVPASVVGFGAGLQTAKVGATMAELRDQAWQNRLIPDQRLMAAVLRQQVLPEYEPEARRRRLVVGFDTSNVAIMADHELKRADKWERLMKAGVARREEARSAFDLPAGDRDRVYLLQAGVLEVPAERPAPVAREEEPVVAAAAAAAASAAPAQAKQRDDEARAAASRELANVVEATGALRRELSLVREGTMRDVDGAGRSKAMAHISEELSIQLGRVEALKRQEQPLTRGEFMEAVAKLIGELHEERAAVWEELERIRADTRAALRLGEQQVGTITEIAARPVVVQLPKPRKFRVLYDDKDRVIGTEPEEEAS